MKNTVKIVIVMIFLIIMILNSEVSYATAQWWTDANDFFQRNRLAW